jgi:predicted TIM-barrel fold metal-dependent hydrolase
MRLSRLGSALALVASSPASAAAADAPRTRPTVFAPAVDYHQHLASPAGTALMNRMLLEQSLPAVRIPADVQTLLDTMTRHWNEEAELAGLYAEDALVLINQTDPGKGWLRGREAAARFASSLYGRPYSILPVYYLTQGSSARVAGYFNRGTGAAERRFAYFYFELTRSGDGKPRILVDNRIFQPRPDYLDTISGEQLVHLLDGAGIGRAIVLSDAYWFDAPTYRPAGQTWSDTYAAVRAENDWTAGEAAQSAGRLVAFCSFNPLAPYALEELQRCGSSGRFAGVKLHLQTSGVDLHDRAQVGRLREVFALADRLRLTLTVHAQTASPYDAEAATAFIRDVVPAAPHVPVIVAHLWGGGPFAAEPLRIYADAVASGAPGTRLLYFDVAEAALVAGGRKEILEQIAAAIRKIGPSRILFGSDAVGGSTLPPLRAAAQFRQDLPLTPEEFSTIAANVLPFLQDRRRGSAGGAKHTRGTP